jgi:hypothetical protein
MGVALMPEDLYCSGQKVLRNTDSWYRTFRGYPRMSGNVKQMIMDYLVEDKIGSILIFFTEHCGFDSDYSEFLLREMIDGKL